MENNRKWIKNRAKEQIIGRSTIFLHSLKRINEDLLRRDTKHTFFPGNEIQRSRLPNISELIIDGDSIFKVCWDLIMIFISILLSFTVPFSISFYVDLPYSITILVTLFNFMNIFFSFNTSFFEQGMLISERSKISEHYLKTWFLLDLLASFPYEFFVPYGYQKQGPTYYPQINYNSLRYLLLFKLVRLFKYRETLFNLQQIMAYSIIYSLTSIFTYIYCALLFLHILTCINNMIYCKGLSEGYEIYFYPVYLDNKTRYLKLLLRMTETITSVGYGDFVPKSHLEIIISIFIMSLASSFLGYCISGIQSSIEKSNQLELYFQEVQRKLKKYLTHHKASENLKFRVQSYIRNLKQVHTENLIQEQDILNLLSYPMKEELYANLQGHYLIKVPEFESITGTCLRAISSKLKLELFAPNDLIINQNEVGSDLFFVAGGHAEVFHYSTKTMFKVLGRFHYFGEISFFGGGKRKASVKSYDYCEILKLKKYDFTEILNALPKDKDKISALMRNLTRYGVSVLKIKCYLCDELGHCAIDCAKHKYNPRPVIRKHKKKYNIVPATFAATKSPKLWQRYSLSSTKGSFKVNESLKINSSLKDNIEHYSRWLNTASRHSRKVIELIKPKEVIDEVSDEGSNSSRDAYFKYQLNRKGDITPLPQLQKPDFTFRRINTLKVEINKLNPLGDGSERYNSK